MNVRPGRGIVVGGVLVAGGITLYLVLAMDRPVDHLPQASPQARPTATLDRGPAPHRSAPSPARSRSPASRSLLAEAARLELDQGGLLIDLGSADQHKYLAMDWGVRRWRPGRDGEITFVEAGQSFRLAFFDAKGGVRRLVLRLRARHEGTTFGLRVNGFDAPLRPPKPLTDAWETRQIELPEKSVKGLFSLEFILDESRENGEQVEIDWVWLARGDGEPPRLGKVAVQQVGGDPRRSLLARAGRSYAWYGLVPPKARLSFAAGSERAVMFEVRATTDRVPLRILWRGRSRPKTWQRASVDLGELAGEVARLELVSHGPGAWAEPALVIRDAATQPAPVPSEKRARNLVHLLVDAARQDHFTSFNPATPVSTPALQGLAQGGVSFEHALTNANWTLPSVASMLSGRYPSTIDGRRGQFRLAEDLPLLPEHLKRHGFATAAFVGNRYVSAAFGLARGWDRHQLFPKQGRGVASDSAIVAAAVQWLQRRDRSKRFYLYVHTMAPHLPYRWRPGQTQKLLSGPPSRSIGRRFTMDHVQRFRDKKRRFSEVDRQTIRALYGGEVAHHDMLLAWLIQTLRQEDLLADTLVVFSNDHGEELLDHGDLTHGHSHHDELIRCPLVLRYPPLFVAGTKVRAPVELVDLAPTVTDVLGLPPLPGAHGKSLRRAAAGVVDAHYGLAVSGVMGGAARLDRHKLIVDQQGSRLFDLTADPKETRDLLGQRPLTARACQLLLREAAFVPDKGRRLSPNLDGLGDCGEPLAPLLDPAIKHQLNALGYVQ